VKTIKVSNISHYGGPLRLIEDRHGNRYLAIHCSLKGERYYGPLKRHQVLSFNAIADLQEVDADSLDQRGIGTPEQVMPRGDDLASAEEEEMEFFVFGLGKDYEQGSLHAHLGYLQKYSGTPDFITRADTLTEAVDEARDSAPAAITNHLYEVISVVKEAEAH
jgi:hypothetical protein